MIEMISPNTQAILLLTAPLGVKRNLHSPSVLTLREYKELARFLRELDRQPFDLLSSDAAALIDRCSHLVEIDRLRGLLGRGFLLSQAIERWHSRAIWVLSRADTRYPKRLKSRLQEDAPPILYGCGEASILDTGALAVVGSRDVSDELIAYSHGVGRIAADAKRTIVSGGARGVDLAAMRGALGNDGKVVGVLAEGLEQMAIRRENRDHLMRGRLVFISPYDPQAGFNVGHAMQRNKLIYAFADAALVVNSDFERGGTWAGAIEQIERLHFAPVYVRSTGLKSNGLHALKDKGALAWPEPNTPDALVNLLLNQPKFMRHSEAIVRGKIDEQKKQHRELSATEEHSDQETTKFVAADALFCTVRELLQKIKGPITESEASEYLGVSKGQVKDWLRRLVKEGTLERQANSLKYSLKRSAPLFQ